jgi:hypothetical protein
MMKRTLLLLGLGVCLACTCRAFDMGGANDITAVSGRTSPDYVRTRQADGSFAPESYAFGKGGTWSGAMEDLSIDRMTFLGVAHVIAVPLASKNYLPSRDPKSAKLLIMVYWGTTHAPENASGSNAYLRASNVMRFWKTGGPGFPPPGARGVMIKAVTASSGMPSLGETLLESQAMSAVEAENRMRDKEDALNASMLGYDSWWLQTANYKDTPLDIFRQDMLDELENDRYFVVLMAYDFQIMWKQKKHKLLWETRFSVRQRHHDFDKDLPAMAQYASRFFGQDSQGLVRESVPFGHVDIGELKSLGTVPGK